MRLLLDTHALIWALAGSDRLSPAATAVIEDGENLLVVSAVSSFEIATKVRIGKLPDARSLADAFEAEVAALAPTLLPITVAHALRAGSLAIPHKDPFDRLLIAQAQLEGLTLVSNEALFDGYGVHRLW